jgi:hypothetical protein
MEEVENEKAVKVFFFASFQTPRLRGLRVGEASTPGGERKSSKCKVRIRF